MDQLITETKTDIKSSSSSQFEPSLILGNQHLNKKFSPKNEFLTVIKIIPIYIILTAYLTCVTCHNKKWIMVKKLSIFNFCLI